MHGSGSSSGSGSVYRCIVASLYRFLVVANLKLSLKISNMNEYQSLLHSLSLNNKGKLIWTASYDSLQRFVEEYLNLRERSWSSPGGDGKLYEAGDVSIKWYANSQTITVYGENKAEVEEKLKSAASVSKDLWSIKS